MHTSGILASLGAKVARGQADPDEFEVAVIEASNTTRDPEAFRQAAFEAARGGQSAARSLQDRVLVADSHPETLALSFCASHRAPHGRAGVLVDGDVILTYDPAIGWQEFPRPDRLIIPWLNRLDCLDPDGNRVPYGDDLVKRRIMRESIPAYAPEVRRADFPVWIGPGRPNLESKLVVANGILGMKTGQLADHDSRLVTLRRIPIAWDPNAPEPVEWISMIERIAPDPQSVRLLQQWFGYCLDGGPPVHQKALWLYGLPRSGKGTIIRVLGTLLGPTARTSEFSGFGGPHALSAIVGAKLLSFPEVKVDHRGIGATMGRLLSIIGNDPITVNPKNRDEYSTTVNTRVMFASNDLPRKLADIHGGLVARLMFFETRGSWVGREDPTLEAKITAEMPGILKWAVEGWRDLHESGRFVDSPSSDRVKRVFQRRSSDAAEFVEERMDVTGRHEDAIPWIAVREMWREWCEDNTIHDRRTSVLKDYLRSVQAVGKHFVNGNFPEAREKGSTNRKLWVRGVKLK